MTKEEYIARVKRFRQATAAPLSLEGDESKWAQRMLELQTKCDTHNLALIDEEIRRLEAKD